MIRVALLFLCTVYVMRDMNLIEVGRNFFSSFRITQSASSSKRVMKNAMQKKKYIEKELILKRWLILNQKKHCGRYKINR